MRFLAALGVFVFHGTWYVGMFPEPVFPETLSFITSMGGNLGVSFFFVLSGFVLTWSARPADTLVRFWRRRFVKVYPNHVVVALITIGLFAVTGAAIDGVVPNLLLIQSWFSNLLITVGINGVSWSLSCEVAFYVMFPFWLALVRRIRPERLWTYAGGVVAVIFCMPLVAQLLPTSPSMLWSATPMWHNWFVYFFPMTRMLEFLLGILVAQIVISRRWINIRVWMAVVALAASYVVSLYAPVLYSGAAIMVVPVTLLVAALAVADAERGQRSFLSSRTMIWLGNISFAFYMLHRQVLHHVILLFQRPDTKWTAMSAMGVVLLALPVTVLLAWALYSFVEEPAMRKFAEPRRRRAVAVLPPAPGAEPDEPVAKAS